MGGWHATAEREVKKLGSALARHTGQLEGEAISHLWGRLGILLQRGNAALLGNRVPAYPEAVIDGIEKITFNFKVVRLICNVYPALSLTNCVQPPENNAI